MDERKETFSGTDLDHFLQQTRDSEEDPNDLNRNLFEVRAAPCRKSRVRECLVPRKEIEGVDISLCYGKKSGKNSSTPG